MCVRACVTYLIKGGVVGALPGAGLLDVIATHDLHDWVQLPSQEFAGFKHVDTYLHTIHMYMGR